MPLLPCNTDDSAAHVAEEVASAAKSGPLAIITAVGGTWLLGWFVLITTAFVITDVNEILGSALSLPMAQVYYDTLGKKGMLAL
jgi:amino acid transporter